MIKSQLILFHRICSIPGDIEEATRSLFSALRPRGYSRGFLRAVEVNQTFQTHGAYQVERENRPVVPFVGTYSQALVALNLNKSFNRPRMIVRP